MKHLKTEQTPDIDWSKPMWVIDRSNNRIILTTGEHSGNNFTGTCMPDGMYKNGDYATCWSKDMFSPISGTIMFPISNED